MTKLNSEVFKKLDLLAPLSLAESWDNVGMLIEPEDDVKINKILLTNDLTLDVLEEVKEQNAQMILSYHPPLFNSFKRLRPTQWKELITMKCVRHNYYVYSPHTALDSVFGGVNDWLLSPFDVEEKWPIVPYKGYCDQDPMTQPDQMEDDSHLPKASTVSDNKASDKLHKTKADKRHEKYIKQKEYRTLNRKVKRQNRKLKIEQNPLESNDQVPKPCSLKKAVKMADSSCKVNIVVDCSFDDLMSIKDVCKLQNQICNSYALNRRSVSPVQFYITGVDKKLQERFDNTGNNCSEYKSWDINFHQEHFKDLFKKEDIVYLCAESEDVLDEFSDSKAYIIGGLVDHNHHKSLCYEQACASGYKTARLPIQEHLKLKTRTVLSIVHVFEAILRRCEGVSWKECLRNAIPNRKIAGVIDDDSADDKCE